MKDALIGEFFLSVLLLYAQVIWREEPFFLVNFLTQVSQVF